MRSVREFATSTTESISHGTSAREISSAIPCCSHRGFVKFICLQFGAVTRISREYTSFFVFIIFDKIVAVVEILHHVRSGQGLVRQGQIFASGRHLVSQEKSLQLLNLDSSPGRESSFR
jgi:23S rRNA C2498 (ribose-2'-O)-methylase RlmM